MIRLIYILFFIASLSMNAQSIYYVDSDYILNQMSEYKQAQERLKSQTKRWQDEVITKQDSLNAKILAFENEKILLTDDQIELREEELNEEKEALNKLKEDRFGPNGMLIRLRRNLVKPIQTRIANAVQKVVQKQKRRKAGFVLDKGSDLIFLYSDPKYDLSEQVIKELKGKKGDK